MDEERLGKLMCRLPDSSLRESFGGKPGGYQTRGSQLPQ